MSLRQVCSYVLSGAVYLNGACVGPDGNVWFTISDTQLGLTYSGEVGLAKLAPTDMNLYALYSVASTPGGSVGTVISVGGYLWTFGSVAGTVHLYQIDVSSGTPTLTNDFTVGSGTTFPVTSINATPVLDAAGNFWFVGQNAGDVWRCTQAGVASAHTVFTGGTNTVVGITSDGTDLYAVAARSTNNLVKFDTSGTVLSTVSLSITPRSGVAYGGGYLCGLVQHAAGGGGGFDQVWSAPVGSTTATTFTLGSVGAGGPLVVTGYVYDGTQVWLCFTTAGTSNGYLAAYTPGVGWDDYEAGIDSLGAGLYASPAATATDVFFPDWFTGGSDWSTTFCGLAQGLVMLP